VFTSHFFFNHKTTFQHLTADQKSPHGVHDRSATEQGKSSMNADPCVFDSYLSLTGTSQVAAMEVNTVIKPKRPLSAYNIFFKAARAEILEELPDVMAANKPRRSHGKIGFKDLAMRISAKWKSLPAEERAYFDSMAAVEKKRYLREKKEWKEATKMQTRAAAPPVKAKAPLEKKPDFKADSGCFPESKGDSVRRFSLSDSLPRIDAGGSVWSQAKYNFKNHQGLKSASTMCNEPPVGQNASLWSMGFCSQERLWLDLDDTLQLQNVPNSLSRDPHANDNLSPLLNLDQLSAELDEECKTLLKNMFQTL
jgi:HMG (high mobility group) box